MTVTPERRKRIMDLGLTEYQARVYLALLELGSSKAAALASVANVPRTRVYATMNQLHEKGLVEIVPETPLRYRPVPIRLYLEKNARALREDARQLEEQVADLQREFAVKGEMALEERGRFEAIYGRRNAHERLLRMYDGARQRILGIGTANSPSRIVKSAIYTLEEKAKEGVSIRYAFPVTAQNREQVDEIGRFARVKAINVHLPIYFYVFDQREILLTHPLPDDDNFYRGDDVAIWTNNPGIARALETIAEKIWNSGTEPGTVDVTEPAFQLARQFVQLLGHRGRPAFEAMGREVGREMARALKARELPDLLPELETYWRRNALGRLTVVSSEPLVLEVENFVDCGKMLSVGRTVCGFVEAALVAVLEAKVGAVEVAESVCRGPRSNECRFAFRLPAA